MALAIKHQHIQVEIKNTLISNERGGAGREERKKEKERKKGFSDSVQKVAGWHPVILLCSW